MITPFDAFSVKVVPVQPGDEHEPEPGHMLTNEQRSIFCKRSSTTKEPR